MQNPSSHSMAGFSRPLRKPVRGTDRRWAAARRGSVDILAVSLARFRTAALPVEGRDMADETAAVSDLLDAYRRGDETALEKLVPLVYEDLRLLARRQRRRLRPGETLNTTALVHEAYLKLADHAGAGWQNRAHFLAVASRAMRQILVDYARRRSAGKRGGGAALLPLEERDAAVERDAERMLALDEALEGLGRLDPRLPRVVECRFFGGLTEEETAGRWASRRARCSATGCAPAPGSAKRAQASAIRPSRRDPRLEGSPESARFPAAADRRGLRRRSGAGRTRKSGVRRRGLRPGS